LTNPRAAPGRPYARTVPFRSSRQRRYLFARRPKVAAQLAKHPKRRRRRRR